MNAGRAGAQVGAGGYFQPRAAAQGGYRDEEGEGFGQPQANNNRPNPNANARGDFNAFAGRGVAIGN